MPQSTREWLKQAEYDIEAAQAMFDTGRYFYAAFMCHLSIEKALKAVYVARLHKVPPRHHNLIKFVRDTTLTPPPKLGNFIVKLNEVCVATRYPENLAKLQRAHTAKRAAKLLAQSREALAWIKTQS